MSTAFNPLNPLAAQHSELPPLPDEPAQGAYSRPAALSEIAIGLALLEAALWTEGAARWGWSLAAAVWIIGVTLYRQPSLRRLGLGWTGVLRSLWVVGAAALASGLILAVGGIAGTVHPYVLRRSLYVAVFGYLFWTLQQQFMLQSFFFQRLERLLGSRQAVWAGAALFAFAHIPNPVLIPTTFVAGLFFCEVFRRYRNIYTLAIAQTILGICLAAAVPDVLHHHMRVGAGYLTWVAHHSALTPTTGK